MKKGRIAMLIGITAVLVMSPTLFAYWGDPNLACYVDVATRECMLGPSAGCTADQVVKYIDQGECGDYFNAIRDSDIYAGEDDDYFYFSMRVVDLETGSMTADPNGTALFLAPKSDIQDWIDDGCHTQQP